MSQHNQRPLTVACPQCQKKVVWSEKNPYRPFCSERCKLIDLGAWADESHRIAGEPALDETNIEEWLTRADQGDDR
ncbi:DNA gyrase inhibitor YacG [Halomonas sp. LR3S48]|uniref:DNA gyrase inhibitor YacG n=1 Tax=Halomonadaceae TaxID=28256 RepID=UPI0021E43AE5|nr:DNA gyrase inhibitor YacG [Halomonas sp. LR3S48]UYG01980.1 DNA gyrase inhibitor YacG [Halomonas sp. LR3S48]